MLRPSDWQRRDDVTPAPRSNRPRYGALKGRYGDAVPSERMRR